MAKPAWLTSDPSSGSGSETVNFTSTAAHTGRTNRTGTANFASTAPDAPLGVTQTAKAEFVEVSDISAPKNGGNVTITGTSNSAKLTFSLSTGDIVISLPASYTAAGQTTANGANISGDPGAVAAYEFSIVINVPANETTSSMTRTITVTANGGQADSATITQASGDPFLTISPTSITLDWEGTPVAVSVTSNTNWTVE